jgi:ribose transport system substrate-binding protein
VSVRRNLQGPLPAMLTIQPHIGIGSMRIDIRQMVRPFAAITLGILCGCLAALLPAAHIALPPPFIAFIARTSGTTFTEDMHQGAREPARNAGYQLYWNAPTREDDLDRQILIADAAVQRGAKAIILGPTNVSGAITMIHNLVARKLPVVIVQTEVPMPASPYLTSVTPDQSEFGRLAAERISKVTGGTGEVAIVGLDRGAPETLTRAQSFMKAIAAHPGIRVVTQSPGSIQISETEQNAREIVNSFPRLRAIYAVSADATQGVMLALQEVDASHSIALVGSDRDLFLTASLYEGKLDSLVIADGRRIGYLAMQAALAGLHGRPLPAPEKVEATLLTRNNLVEAGNR